MKEMSVFIRTYNSARGFTTLELTVVILITGIIAAIATPKITTAMREYRVSVAVRQMSDLIQRAKVQATSENHDVALRVDTSSNRAGLVVYDANGAELRTDYVSLPSGVTFVLPAGVTAPVTGAPIDSCVSFNLKAGSTTIYEQRFTSRGFPAVAAGTINAIYVGSNNQSYRALTLNSVGGMRTWTWQNNQWVDTRHT
jgi:type II secretory pathway pseudopilin PulG